MNIINAVFGGNSRYCTTRSVFQIDKGDILRFVGLDLPEYYEVHFSNSKNSLAKRVLASGDSVVIPWEFMRHGQKEVFAWVYLTPDAESGYTPYQVTIPLNLRSDISESQPTPAQEDIVAEAISALNEGVERTEKAADDAEEAVRHYPRIVNGYWQVWDVDTQQWQETGVKAVGEDGLPGRDGRDGADGQVGAPGVTYTPTVSADGEISWTNDGGLPNPQPRNIIGPQGQDGATGPNQVTTNTSTNITGILKGAGSTVSAATPGTDYATPQQVDAKYTKPASGIPATDMAQDVQTSLGKADTAIQPADYAPEAKTAAMTQPVGADSGGKLWTKPGGGGASIDLGITGASTGDIAEVASTDQEGSPTSWRISEIATEATAQQTLAAEDDGAFWLGRVLMVMDGLADDLIAMVEAEIAKLPQDENGQAIAASIGEGNSWLNMLYHELEVD